MKTVIFANELTGQFTEQRDPGIFQAVQHEYIRADLVQRLKGYAERAIRIADSNVCRHEETYRGGAIWTICRSCGAKWADDEGGFVPSKTAIEIDEITCGLTEVLKEME